MTTSPNLGVIIPPSISMIFYSMISNVSLEGLFITGFIPGLLIIACVCLYTWLKYRNRTDIKRLPAPRLRDLLTIFREGFWALMLIVIIFGGIFRVCSQPTKPLWWHLYTLFSWNFLFTGP